MDWSDAEIAEVNSMLDSTGRQKPVELPPSPHGALPSGAADYRQFPLSRGSMVKIQHADFTRARSPSNPYGVDEWIMLTWVECARVTFDRARVFHKLSGRYEHCSFIRIGTSGCGFSGTFTDCDFTGTSFRAARPGANFVRCRFHGCNLKVASWRSSFEDCEFAGASFDPLFADVRDVALSSDRVTFAAVGGKIHPGETRHIS